MVSADFEHAEAAKVTVRSTANRLRTFRELCIGPLSVLVVLRGVVSRLRNSTACIKALWWVNLPRSALGRDLGLDQRAQILGRLHQS